MKFGDNTKPRREGGPHDNLCAHGSSQGSRRLRTLAAPIPAQTWSLRRPASREEQSDIPRQRPSSQHQVWKQTSTQDPASSHAGAAPALRGPVHALLPQAFVPALPFCLFCSFFAAQFKLSLPADSSCPGQPAHSPSAGRHLSSMAPAQFVRNLTRLPHT